MLKYDVLLTYEIRNREIESVCLLRMELERRGYKVGIVPQYNTFFESPEPVEADVVLVPAYYRDRAKFYASSHTVKTDKIINLQWEQMYRNLDMTGDTYLKATKPWGRSAVHIAWGDKTFERMTEEWHVPARNVTVTGHIAMDFLRGPLARYYMDRETLFKQYDIPADKKVCLFISSFTYQTMHERFLKGMGHVNEDGKSFDAYEYRDITIESQKIVLEWFDRLMSGNDDIVVYRPHPEEKDSPILAEMCRKHPNFRVISDHSVKQWILTTDKLFVWLSTSIVEAYIAGKSCGILRPIAMPEHIELCIYNDAEFITDYDTFEKAYNSEEISFPMKRENIEAFYYVPHGTYSYQLVADVVEKVLQDDSYTLEQPMKNPFYPRFFNLERTKNVIKRAVAGSSLCQMIHDKDLLAGTKLRENIDDVIYLRDKLKRHETPQEALDEMSNRMRAIIEGGGEESLK